MTYLRRDQARKVLDCLSSVYACRTWESFPGEVLRSLQGVIAADYAIYNEMSVARHRLTGVSWPSNIPWPDPTEAQQFFSQHPFIAHLRRTGDVPAKRISDFMSKRVWRETPLYRELFSGLGVGHQLGCALPNPTPTHMVAVSFIRKSGEFSEADKVSLDLLRPHLLQAYRTAEELSNLGDLISLLKRGLEGLDQGILVLSRHGHIRFSSNRARRWLADYFQTSPRTGGKLPPEVSRWLKRQALPPSSRGTLAAVPRPLIANRPGRQLRIRLSRQGGEDRFLLLDERRTEPSIGPLMGLGLTRREAEVLLWVAQGKTNPETGIILGLSAGTVHKHLEHIFDKLSVETRTAAAALAHQAMQTNWTG